MAKKNASRKKPRSGPSGGDGTGSDVVEADNPADFERALSDVEQIVTRLEGGELGLAESLDQYQVAVGKLKTCHRLLEAAERRIEVLAGFDAECNPVTEPLDEGPDATLAEKQRSRSRRRGAAAEPGDENPHDAGMRQGGGRVDRGDTGESGGVDDPPQLF
jgi:exodeoxyribonuclease VII small subunit